MSAVISAQGRLPSFGQARFERWWDMGGEWVEEPNQRRGGESGVKLLPAQGRGQPRLYSKRQVGHIYRSWLHPLGRPTVLREEEALRACEQLQVPVPKLVFCAARREKGQWQGLLVTEELSGFVSLGQWYASEAPSAQRRAVLQQLAVVLRRLHGGRRQHGCLYAKHIYVRVDGEHAEIALLDLEKSRRRLLRSRAVRHDLDQLRRRREGMPESDWQYFLACYHSLTSGNGDSRHAA
ncbi:lipopolysaccharide kinase InaA family protein [Halopseudomonas sp.]|uniref:lipopolysaccharide kinase InaA family protein n=1 Tax=Halopseudomonas sp. TaxID=2901191 RepID=UPI00311E0749